MLYERWPNPQKTWHYTVTAPPSNSEHVILVDTTRLGLGTYTSASVATGAAGLVPSTDRAAFAGYKVIATIKNGDQAATVYEQALTGVAGDATDWETESLGTIALAASTTYFLEWKPSGIDFRLLFTAGSNNPDALSVNIALIPCTDYGT